MTIHDPRLTPARPDLAAARLRGIVEAERYVEGRRCQVSAEVLDLKRQPRPDAALDTQFLCGEVLHVYDEEDGWAWVQAERDGYVGYVATHGLSDEIVAADAPSRREPHLRVPGARHEAARRRGTAARRPRRRARYERDVRQASRRRPCRRSSPAGPRPNRGTRRRRCGRAAPRRSLPVGWPNAAGARLLRPRAAQLRDGRDRPAPRHSHAGEVGKSPSRPTIDYSGLERGDLVFWPGHVGIMGDPEMLIHANGHHMLVAKEPLAKARLRIAGSANITRITSIRRLSQ